MSEVSYKWGSTFQGGLPICLHVENKMREFIIITLMVLVTIHIVIQRYLYNYIPRGMTLIFANKGTGKTSRLAWYTQLVLNDKRYKKRYPNGVYSTVPISGAKKFDVRSDLGIKHIEGALILIDEAGIDLKNTKPLTHAQMSYLKLSRHYTTDLIFVSQDVEDISIVVRRLYDNLYVMFNGLRKHVTHVRAVKKFITVDEELGEVVSRYAWKYPYLFKQVINRRKTYKYFNTHDRPQLEMMEDEYYQSIEERAFMLQQIEKVKKVLKLSA